MTEEKYCINCKFFRRAHICIWCDSPKLGKSLVTGEINSQIASVARMSLCKGNWFEGKEVEAPKKKWW